ncbi:hypothetical protein SLS62_003119 [Diatrype stigma]|uniref:Uncharacterized protein n=1 Tax=Diatrype stigma TaxID=117547 RepID=A0AAN9YUV7_9PEZI
MPSYKYHQKKLGELVSHAGIRYLTKQDIFARARRNEIVLQALKKAGVVLNKQSVDAEMVAVFRAAQEELSVFLSFDTLPKDLNDFLENLQRKHAMNGLPRWAAELSTSTFFELFWRLVEARHKWVEDPAPPFDEWAQSPVVAAVDGFVDYFPLGCGYEWIEMHVEFFDLVGGLDSDEDENEEKKKEEEEKKAAGEDMEMSGLGEVVGEMEREEEDRVAMEGEIPEGVEKMDLS